MVLIELARCIRFYQFCIQGPNPGKIWVFKQVLAYRRNRKTLMRENRLGYSHKLTDWILVKSRWIHARYKSYRSKTPTEADQTLKQNQAQV